MTAADTLKRVDLEDDIETNLSRLQDQIDALKDLPATARLSVANVTADSVIVVETDQLLSAEAAERMRDSLKRVWPDNKVVVCVRGVRLKIDDGEADS